MKTILLMVRDEEIKLAVISKGKLVDFAVERPGDGHLVNHVYKGLVNNIVPGIEAAFVDIGEDRNGFLYLATADLKNAKKSKHNITDGANVLVQVAKDERGTKGPTLTTDLSIAGRYTVLLPTAGYIGVSKKIKTEEERQRLRLLGQKECKKGEGLVFRTSAAGISEEELTWDIAYLLRTWENILRRAAISKAPTLLYREADLIIRAGRDYAIDADDRIITDDKLACERLQDLFGINETRRQNIYVEESLDLFDQYGVTEKIEELFSRQVNLPSGGNIIIEHTEALTVIDVNSSKYKGRNASLAHTVFEVNKEAATEIAHQIRLRDIGGMILVDFIDMADLGQREDLIKQLRVATSGDRTRTVVVGMTALGLVEMTRKKTRSALWDSHYDTCSACLGSGKTLSVESIAIKILNSLDDLIKRRRVKGDLLVEAHPEVVFYFADKNRSKSLQARYHREIVFENNSHNNREVFSVLAR